MTEPTETLPWPEIIRQATHDLRTPLSSIVMAASVLRQLPPESAEVDRERMLALLEREVGVLSECVRRLAESPESFLGAGIVDP